MYAFAKIDRESFYRSVSSRLEGRCQYEYVRGRIVRQMTGGTNRHGLVARHALARNRTRAFSVEFPLSVVCRGIGE